MQQVAFVQRPVLAGCSGCACNKKQERADVALRPRARFSLGHGSAALLQQQPVLTTATPSMLGVQLGRGPPPTATIFRMLCVPEDQR